MTYFENSINHPIHSSFTGFSSAINTEELSILSALPNSDVDGISVSKVSSFGLTQAKIDKYNSIEIGNVLNKGNHKIKVKIDADGYKTFFGTIYLTKLGCRIDSEMWSYNPDFKPEFIPKNEITSTLINSKFDFLLVKA